MTLALGTVIDDTARSAERLESQARHKPMYVRMLTPPSCGRCIILAGRTYHTAFERHLRELLRKLHGNSRHIGRQYEPPAPELLERVGSVAQLRERLRRAIDSEQFELAAELRDRLRSVES